MKLKLIFFGLNIINTVILPIKFIKNFFFCAIKINLGLIYQKINFILLKKNFFFLVYKNYFKALLS